MEFFSKLCSNKRIREIENKAFCEDELKERGIRGGYQGVRHIQPNLPKTRPNLQRSLTVGGIGYKSRSLSLIIAAIRAIFGPLFYYKKKVKSMVKTYGLSRDGNQKLSNSFTVREFRCRDGSDKILIDTDLVSFNAPMTINSAYRNATYNRKIGGASKSQHIKGIAADIAVHGVSPLKVAQYAEYLGAGGIGWYKTFTHVDVRQSKSRCHYARAI